MKKLIVVALLITVPLAVFADLQIGALGLYNGTLSSATTSTSRISASDFTYGLESRLNIWIFQGAVSALYIPGDDFYGTYDTVLAMTDVGLCFDLWILRLGAGVGPNFGFIMDKSVSASSSTQKLGFNGKVAADLNLGNLGLGLVGYYYIDSLAELRDMSASDLKNMSNWMVGVSLLFKLF